MSYIGPGEVHSPRKRVGSILEVIHDPGENEMSVARIIWDEESVVAIRWNGNSDEPLGNSMSRRQPTWFVVGEYPRPASNKQRAKLPNAHPTVWLQSIARWPTIRSVSARPRSGARG
jgi:hypothetical protein